MTIAQVLTSNEAVGVYVLIAAGLEKKFQFIKPVVKFIETHKGLVKEAEKVGEAILETPAAKAVEAKLHLELNHATDELKKSALAQWAQAALRGAKKSWDELSPAEQGAALAFVQAHMPSGVTATEKEIAVAFQDVPKLAEMFAGDAAYNKAQELTALLTRANSPTDNGQAS